ncbi:MAG: ComF family protein [Firmicutes bacterium]|nr:ComF family protein [Bacillota bacterium]
MKLKEIIDDLLFPKGLYCITCGKYIDNTRTYCLCDHCIRHMSFGSRDLECGEYLDKASAAMGYGLYERRIVFNLKYDGKTYLAPIIADILYDSLMERLYSGKDCPYTDADLIVPVPVHEYRLRERGFNQTEKIAKHLSAKLSIKMDGLSLKRVKHTDAQRALSAEERAENMESAFNVPPDRIQKIKGKKIILLDDIFTTGATAFSCAKTLKEAGAEKIYLLTLLSAGNRHHLMIK